MDLDLKDKVAIITGGSDGIGRATAYKLSSEGVSVTVCARGTDKLNRAAEEIRVATGNPVLAVSADVRSDDDVKNVVDLTLKTFGAIDILFNNAGSSHAQAFLDVSDDIWHEDLDVKLFGAVRFCRAVIPHLRQRGGGRIVNVTTGGESTADIRQSRRGNQLLEEPRARVRSRRYLGELYLHWSHQERVLG